MSEPQAIDDHRSGAATIPAKLAIASADSQVVDAGEADRGAVDRRGPCSDERAGHQWSFPMSHPFLDIAVTPSVRAVQAAMGTDRVWDKFKSRRTFDRFGEDEVAFIAERDSFYMASVSETGWPYVQHRGGPRGFLKLVDDRTLAFADYRGNLQYISTGNFAADGRASLFLMNYPRQARLKIYAHVETLALDAEPALTELVCPGEYRATVERIFRLRLDAFDWNCPQHITPRFTQEEVADAVRPLRDRLAQLEADNAELRARLSTGSPPA
jgi:predicted pyridoxine 5'-phosphate oxidase superfamily flavin-nucleotide-binding protein